jgi:hypothetical protein
LSFCRNPALVILFIILPRSAQKLNSVDISRYLSIIEQEFVYTQGEIMSSATVKIGVSLPKEKFSAVEKMRKKLKKTRSALITEAITLWLNEKQEEELVKRYVAGYKERPETKKERDEALAISQEALGFEEWPR